MKVCMLVASCLVGSRAAAAAEPTLLGEWARGDSQANVVIEPCGSSLCAVNTWVAATASGEKVGDRLVMEVVQQSPAVWSGKVWDPQRSMSYSLRIETADQKMTTRGCILLGVFCANMTWSKLISITK